MFLYLRVSLIQAFRYESLSKHFTSTGEAGVGSSVLSSLYNLSCFSGFFASWYKHELTDTDVWKKNTHLLVLVIVDSSASKPEIYLTGNKIHSGLKHNNIFLFLSWLHVSVKFDVHVTVHRVKFLIIKPTRCIQLRSKDSQVKTQLVLWIFIYLRWQGDNMFRPLSPGHHQVTIK